MVTKNQYKPTKFVRFVLYPLAGIIFLIMLTVLLTMANGYRFTFTNGKPGYIKTGMLVVSTRPFDAQIKINGKVSKRKTGFYLLPTKLSNLLPGKYAIELSKQGYRTWKDSLSVKPGLVTWANYVLLFAEKLNITTITTPSGKVVAKSDNGRHILFSSAGNTFNLQSLDSNNLSLKEFWPTTSPTENWLINPDIKEAVFSPNNDRALLKIANAGRMEYVVADASGNQPELIHLNSTLKNDFTGVWWNVSSNSELYLQTSKGLSLAKIQDTSLASPILADFISMEIDESKQIIYVQKDSAGVYSVNMINLDGTNRVTLVDSIPPSKSYKMGFSTKNSVLTVLNQDTGGLTAYYVDGANKDRSIELSAGVTSFSWSKNGQYLLYYGDDFIKRYDWLKEEEALVALTKAPIKVEWYFDEFHYLVSNAGGIYEMDYDGSNVVPIVESSPVFYALDLGSHNIMFATKNSLGANTFYKFISEF